MGPGSDTVDVSSDAPTNAGHLNDLRGALTVDAGTGATEIIRLSDAGDGTPNTGTLTPTTITGLGTAGITYLGFTQLILTLGSGSDTLDVQGTIPGSTTINGGNGNDRLTLATLTGVVLVNAGGGDDHATIRSTVAGSAVTFNGDAGADWVDIVAMLGTVTVAGGSDNDTVEVGSNSETTLRAVDLGGNVNAIAGLLVVNGDGGTDALYLDETGDASSAAVNDGILTSTTVTGLGLGNPLTYGTLELLTIRLGAGDTQFDVLSTANASVLELGDGADVVNVSSDAPSNLGTLDLLAGHLTIDGQGGVDTVNLSDVGDTDDNTGTLTATDLTGLGTAGVTYAALEFLNIGLGSGNDTFNVQSTLLGALTTVDAGPGTDVINVSSDAPANVGTVDLLAGHLVLLGGTGADILIVSDVSDTTDDTGRLTDTTITGLDTAGIEYFSFSFLTLTLGSGADTFYVDSTHAGETTLNTGPGVDLVYIETIAGRTWVNGNAGNDTIRVNHLLDEPTTANGIGALLTLDGGAGDDLYVINEFGNGNSTIEVYDSGAALERNELIINGTPNADLFLLRARLVALLNSPTQVERVRYTGSFEPGDVGGVWRYGLLINSLGGDDHFALDDNTAQTTINGGEGNDLFQVGQLWGAFTPADPTEAPVVRMTTRGELTNGVSFETTINGGNGNDLFSVFSNVAPLHLNGDAGDDTFVIRTFLLDDGTSNVSGGGGADLIQYVANAPISVDGGDGSDKLVLIGTEAPDVFLVTSDALFGAGRVVTYTNIEKLDIDGMEGADWIVIHSTRADVLLRIFGNLGSDTVEIGGAVPPRCGAGVTGRCVEPGSTAPTLPATDPRLTLIAGPVFVFGGDRSRGRPRLPRARAAAGRERDRAAHPRQPGLRGARGERRSTRSASSTRRAPRTTSAP